MKSKEKQTDEISEFKCRKCKGKTGFVHEAPSNEINHIGWVTCGLCGGTGDVDWIENIVGKKITIDPYETIKGYLYKKYYRKRDNNRSL